MRILFQLVVQMYSKVMICDDKVGNINEFCIFEGKY